MKKLFLLSSSGLMIFGGIYLLAGDYKKDEYETSINTQMQNTSSYKLYVNECGSCHMAYQAEFLPKRSWSKMMNTLQDHFGMDATMDLEDTKIISKYLKDNAADAKATNRYLKKMAASIREDNVVLRISDIPYLKREHAEFPKKYVKQKEVGSLSNCMACHKKADIGDYSEHNIFIPNYGRWDD